MNELVCVYELTKNLLSRIPIRDLTFCDESFTIFDNFIFFKKIMISIEGLKTFETKIYYTLNIK